MTFATEYIHIAKLLSHRQAIPSSILTIFSQFNRRKKFRFGKCST